MADRPRQRLPALPLPMTGPSLPAHVRVCRECGEEYRPETVRCADCGGDLEDRFLGETEGAATSAAKPKDEPSPDLAGYRPLFLTARAADLVPMAERLREAGVLYRLAEQAGKVDAPARYALLVKDDDAAHALGVLAELVAPHEGKEEIQAVDTRFDAEKGYLECPACGARTAPGAGECPECGLSLGGGEGQAEEPPD